MNRPVKKISGRSTENLLAPDPSDVVSFRKYTQRVWSKVAGRPISEIEADQIIENFSRFILALSGINGEQS
jgi:hypothetical protein